MYLLEPFVLFCFVLCFFETAFLCSFGAPPRLSLVDQAKELTVKRDKHTVNKMVGKDMYFMDTLCL